MKLLAGALADYDLGLHFRSPLTGSSLGLREIGNALSAGSLLV
jgi:hypothetical protein